LLVSVSERVPEQQLPATMRPPNILVTGTPGTGKTSTCEQIAAATGLRHINVGDRVKAQDLHCGYDEEHQAFIIDEDKVVDALEDELSAGGCIVDYHSCDFFPERWFDLVLVLQTDNTVLYNRLEARGYPAAKIQENVECEIMMVLLEEAAESYKQEIVVPLASNSVEDLESNVSRAAQWVAAYKQQHGL
jgi:adenylate kinase